MWNLVVTIAGMAMIGFPTKLIVPVMGVHDGYNRGYEKPQLEIMPVLLGEQQEYTYTKQQIRPRFMMMTPVTMPKCVCSN